jgi:hypothetical protein
MSISLQNFIEFPICYAIEAFIVLQLHSHMILILILLVKSLVFHKVSKLRDIWA